MIPSSTKLDRLSHTDTKQCAKPACAALIGQLVNWCSEPSQPLGIISGLKETLIKRLFMWLKGHQ